MINRKRYMALGVIAALLSAQPAAYAQVSVADVKLMKQRAQVGGFSGRADWTALSYYLQGALEAIGLAQQHLERGDKQPLFCPPKGSSLTLDDIHKFLNKASEDGQKGSALNAILKDLKTRYPCTGGR